MNTVKNKARFGAQISYAASGGTGSYVAFSDTIDQNAAMIIFNNQSNVAVTISDDGTTDGMTFAAGQALVLDLRANVTKRADDFSFPIGTQFYGNSASGTGNFYISAVYAA